MMYLLYDDKELNINISDTGNFYIIEKLIPDFGNIIINKETNEVFYSDSSSRIMDYIYGERTF